MGEIRVIKTRLGIVAVAALTASSGSPAFADAPSCQAIRLPSQAADAETVKRLEQAWLTAEYRGDVAFLGCLLDPGYSVLGSKTGAVHSKADLLGSFARNQGSTRDVPPLDTKVVVNGAYATAYSAMKGLSKTGDPFEASFVDFYIFADGHWEAVGGIDL